jgi:uncharacterized protein (DUF58 family)
MRNEKSLWFCLLELFLVIVGFISMSPTSLVAAFIALLYFVVASSFNSSGISEVSISRSLSKTRINDEEEIVIEETLTNGGRRPILLEILSELPEELVVREGSNHYIVYLKEKESQRIRFKVKPKFTGHFTLQKISTRILNQLFTSIEQTEKQADASLTVYPLFQELKRFPYGRLSVRPILGQVQSRSAGHGTEFFEIRNYLPTDDFRKINWKAYAKTGALHSNEREWEKMADVYVLLDSTMSAQYFTRQYVRAGATLADFFLRMGNRVGLATIGGFWIWARSGSGRKQLIRLIENLIEARAGNPPTLDNQIEASMRAIPQSSTVVFLSPMRDQRIRGLVQRMIERRQRIIAIVPSSTAEYLTLAESDTPWIADAKQIVRLMRENTLRFLSETRITAIEWDLRSEVSDTLEVLEKWTGRQTMLRE